MLKSILIFLFSLFLYSTCNAQTSLVPLYGTKMNYSRTGMDQFAAEKPKGSPYINSLFSPAKVDGIEGKANMRYNAYLDAIEFISASNDTLALDKIADFGSITFLGSNKKYKLVTYSNNIQKSYQGYLVEVYQKSNYAFLKREWVIFYAGKKAKTSLEKDMPAKFIKQDDSYYLRDSNGNITDFPESKKQLAKLFPNKKEAIEVFVKDNKIDFGADADRIKIIDFLAQ